jgi:hypothetical protein
MSAYRYKSRPTITGRPRRMLAIALGVAVPAALVVGGIAAASARTIRPGRHWPPTASTPAPTASGATASSSGAPASAVATSAPAAATPNPNCTLVVPDNPLTAAGLATPYRLVATAAAAGACHETTAVQAAFVQASVVDPATGAVSNYNPLVIDQGTTATAAPVVPTLPAGAVVAIWFGFNGNVLTLKGASGASLTAGACVNGLNGSIFGQFAYCNAPAFFQAANAAITAGKLTVPALGTGKDGLACPTTRDFGVVDQDQSDNVTGSYLITGAGVAQNTAANRAKLANATVLANGSDNGLIDAHIDPAIGCTPWTAPDLADPGAMSTSLALNELLAAARQGAPIALVPPNDPMVLVNGAASTAKTNLYRVGVNQAAINTAAQTPLAYCQNLATGGMNRLFRDRGFTINAASPDPAAANNLFTFLAQRLQQSFINLNCPKSTGRPAPVRVGRATNGAAIEAVPDPASGVTPPPPTNGTSPTPAPSLSAPETPLPTGTKHF